MSPQSFQIFAWVALIAIAALLLWQSHMTLTAAGITGAAKKAAPLAQELATVAQMGVMAAEQYMQTGEIKTNDEALRFAITFVKRWIPPSRGFTDDDILTAIHSFVPVANALTQQIEAAKTGKTFNPQPVPYVPPTSAPDKPLILGR